MDIQDKYMAVFFNTLSVATASAINIKDKGFQQLLLNFVMNYYVEKYEILNKVFGIKYSKEKGYSYRMNYDEIIKYARMYEFDPQKYCKIYDEIGQNDLDEITKLVETFCMYVDEVNDMKKKNRIRH